MLWEPRPLGTGDPKEAIQLPLSACPPPTHLYGHRIMSPHISRSFHFKHKRLRFELSFMLFSIKGIDLSKPKSTCPLPHPFISTLDNIPPNPAHISIIGFQAQEVKILTFISIFYWVNGLKQTIKNFLLCTCGPHPFAKVTYHFKAKVPYFVYHMIFKGKHSDGVRKVWWDVVLTKIVKSMPYLQIRFWV